MKKEYVISKILLKSLVGFAFGTFMLMLSYILVYLIEGSLLFRQEMMQLLNVKTLIYQMIVSGLVYYLLFILFHTINKQKFSNYIEKHPCITALIVILFATIIALIIPFLISYTKIFSRNIEILFVSLMILACALGSVIFAIKDFVDNMLVKQINNKLKEKNK